MATSENAKVQIESGQSLVTYAQMTDSGDQQVFTVSGGLVWSGRAGYAPVVRPNGIESGRNILSAHASNDTVSIASFTAFIGGTQYSVSATSATFSRPATASKAQVISMTLASDGSTVEAVSGTISATTAFSETRGAAGGPPLIPVKSVELGQIRITAATPAVVASTELYQVPGEHTERWDYPNFSINRIGDGEAATVAAKKNAHVVFDDAMEANHVGSVAKQVFIQYYTPIFSKVQRAIDFTPIEESHSVNSQEFYGGTVASKTSSLGQGSFTALLDDGVRDNLVALKNQLLTFKFFPDENKTPYVLTQGYLGLGRTFPKSNQNQAAATISGETQSAEFNS